MFWLSYKCFSTLCIAFLLKKCHNSCEASQKLLVDSPLDRKEAEEEKERSDKSDSC